MMKIYIILLFFFLNLNSQTNQRKNLNNASKHIEVVENNKEELIKKLSSKVCKEIQALDSEKMNMKIVYEIIFKITKENLEEIKKEYDLDIENGMQIFTNELIKELMPNCKIFHDLVIKNLNGGN